MNIISAKDYGEMSRIACDLTVERIQEYTKPVLGLATGSTPEGLYKCLINYYNNNDFSFKDTTTFNLDEYIGLEEDDINSYHYYMNDKLFNYIDVLKQNTHVPNGMAEDLKRECEQYEKAIDSVGGIDVQLLGLGVNGHIGFNEPGTKFDSRTHVVTLQDPTRNANAHFFASKGEVPERAISMGIATIMESKEIILLVAGKQKAQALSRLVSGDIDERFPASILQTHKNVTIVADSEALSVINAK